MVESMRRTPADVTDQFGRAAALYLEKRYGAAYSIYEDLASDGVVWAYVRLGAMYRDGLGVPANVEKALQWFTKAIDAGSVEALFYAGRLLTDENRHSEALPLYQAAARQDYVPAIYRLGRTYRDGAGVPVDDKLATEFFTRAAAMGNVFAKRELIVRQIKAGSALGRLKGTVAFSQLLWEAIRTKVKDRYSVNLTG